jgi:hypothetical protein
MGMKIERNDREALVLRRSDWIWPVLLGVSLLCLATVSGLIAASWALANIQPAVGILFVLFLQIVFVVVVVSVMCVKPFRQTVTLNRESRRITVEERRLLAASRREIGFEEVRSVAPKGSFVVVLSTVQGEVPIKGCLEAASPNHPQGRGNARWIAGLAREVLNLGESGFAPGVPEIDSAEAQCEGLTSRFGNAGLKVLRDDAEVLILESNGLLATITAGISVGLIAVAMLRRQIARLMFGDALAVAALAWFAISAATICLLPYKRQYAFERVARRMLLVRSGLFRSRSQEFDFDDITDVYVRSHKGRHGPTFHVEMRLTGGRSIDLTPTGFTRLSSDPQARCDELAELFSAALHGDAAASVSADSDSEAPATAGV